MYRLILPRLALLLRFWHITFVIGAIVFSSACRALDTVAVVLSERGGHNTEFLDALNRSLADSPASAKALRVIELPPGGDRPDDATLAGVSSIVAVGMPAMRHVAAWDNLPSAHSLPPVLNVLVPRASYEKMFAEGERVRRRARFSAIYLDQPLVRQINLIRQILPDKKRVSVVVGPDSGTQLPRLRPVITRAGLSIAIEEVGSESEIIPALSRLLPDSDVLLALPDSVVFTRDTARSVLLATYRHQKPLVGFSQAYVNAGALASVFSTPTQIARQTAALLQSLPAGRPAFAAPLYPAFFSVAVNRSVARALALELASDAQLQNAVAAMSEGE